MKREAEIAKTLAKRRGGAAALRAQSGTVPPTPADTSEAQTPRDSGEGPSRQSPVRDLSPVSDASSASEPPLAQARINGTSNHTSAPAAAPTAPSKPVNSPPPPTNLPAPTVSPVIASASVPPPISLLPPVVTPPSPPPPSYDSIFPTPLSGAGPSTQTSAPGPGPTEGAAPAGAPPRATWVRHGTP